MSAKYWTLWTNLGQVISQDPVVWLLVHVGTTHVACCYILLSVTVYTSNVGSCYMLLRSSWYSGKVLVTFTFNNQLVYGHLCWFFMVVVYCYDLGKLPASINQAASNQPANQQSSQPTNHNPTSDVRYPLPDPMYHDGYIVASVMARHAGLVLA